jgi:hypothetical protein
MDTQSNPSVDRACLRVLEAHKFGLALTELSGAIKNVTASVQETGKVGTVTLTMSIKPASKGSIGTLVLETKVKSKCPEAEAPASIFYADSDYNLVREDPNQIVMELRNVAVPALSAPVSVLAPLVSADTLRKL